MKPNLISVVAALLALALWATISYYGHQSFTKTFGYVLGMSLSVLAFKANKIMEDDRQLQSPHKLLRAFFNHGVTITGFLSWLYIAGGIYLFGWIAIAYLISAYLLLQPLLQILLTREDSTPLICFSSIVLSNLLCALSLT